MTHLAALLWTFSILLMLSLVLQTTDAYSTCGRTRELYAMVFISLFLVTTFLLTKPSVLLAVLVMLFMWVFQLRSLLMVTVLQTCLLRYPITVSNPLVQIQTYT